MDDLDLKVSRKLQKLMRRVQQMVDKEVGERMGVALIVFPYTREGEASRVARYQYICNTQREHMREVLKGIVENWDTKVSHVPPHMEH